MKKNKGVSSEFQNIIRHLGNGIYLEDEIEIEKYIRGFSPQETLELQNKFFKDYQTLEKLLQITETMVLEKQIENLEKISRKIDKSLSNRKKRSHHLFPLDLN